jgi:hypothetical protein
MMGHRLPPRDEIRSKIALLRASPISREEVSGWALSIIDDDKIEIDDHIAWKVIKKLGGADLHGGDRPYLYNDDDFSAWEGELT